METSTALWQKPENSHILVLWTLSFLIHSSSSSLLHYSFQSHCHVFSALTPSILNPTLCLLFLSDSFKSCSFSLLIKPTWHTCTWITCMSSSFTIIYVLIILALMFCISFMLIMCTSPETVQLHSLCVVLPPDQIIFGSFGTVFILCPVPSVPLHLKILFFFLCFRTLICSINQLD